MSDDRTIGQRIRTERLRRGKSRAVIAGQAGISVGHLSKMERGLERCDRRSTLTRIADALGVPIGVLTGQPVEPTDAAQIAAQARIPALRLALMDTDLDGYDMPARRPVPQLRAITEQVGGHRQDCDYLTVLGLLPDLITDLHAVALTKEHQVALRALVSACHVRWVWLNTPRSLVTYVR